MTSKSTSPRRLVDRAHHHCLWRTHLTHAEPSTWSFGRDGATKVAVGCTMQADNGEDLLRAA